MLGRMTTPSAVPAIGRDALERHDWEAAFQELAEADRSGLLDAAGLRALAETAWWTGRAEKVLDAGERAYAAYVADGDDAGAAMAAYELTVQHAIRLVPTMAMAWMARAEKHAAEAEGTVASGYVSFLKGMMAIEGEGDADAALEHYAHAREVAEALDDRNLATMATHETGRVMCSRGDQAGGMALMDEAMVTVVGGELRPFAAGVIYCSMISACAEVGDLRRAVEWTDAATRWCERLSINGFPGICRIHRAGILRVRGDLPTAEEEARRACDELPRFNFLVGVGFGFYEIAEIRRRMGDFVGAEEAYARAHEHGKSPQPGLGLLRLAQGRLDAAASGIERALGETEDRQERVRLFHARGEIALEAGDLETARAASAEVDAIAAALPGSTIEAMAACLRGAILIEEGDPDAALPELRASLRSWLDVDAPFEASEVRVFMGKAFRALGDDDAASFELRTARATFERVGAVWAAERAGTLLGQLSSGATEHDRVHRGFVFTDIVRSTDLIELIGDEAWETLLAWHDRTLRSLIASHGGEVAHHTGDGFFAAFESVASGVECAVAIQRALAEHRRDHGFAPTVRIGIHAAEAIRRGEDYSGAGVHLAARVADAAAGGEILVTGDALSAAGDVRVVDERLLTLKGIDGTVAAGTVAWD